MSEEKLEQLEKLCNDTLLALQELTVQLNKIILIKEKKYKHQAEEMKLNPGKEISSELTNLKKINQQLPQQVKSLEQLLKQIQANYVNPARFFKSAKS